MSVYLPIGSGIFSCASVSRPWVSAERRYVGTRTHRLCNVEIPLADAGSLTTGPSADSQATFELRRLPKANWRIGTLSRGIFTLTHN